jgi:hypothetical protein
MVVAGRQLISGHDQAEFSSAAKGGEWPVVFCATSLMQSKDRWPPGKTKSRGGAGFERCTRRPPCQ